MALADYAKAPRWEKGIGGACHTKSGVVDQKDMKKKKKEKRGPWGPRVKRGGFVLAAQGRAFTSRMAFGEKKRGGLISRSRSKRSPRACYEILRCQKRGGKREGVDKRTRSFRGRQRGN